MYRLPKLIAATALLAAWAASAADAHSSVCALSAVPSDIRDTLFLCEQPEPQLVPAIPLPHTLQDASMVEIAPWTVVYPWPPIANPALIDLATE